MVEDVSLADVNEDIITEEVSPESVHIVKENLEKMQPKEPNKETNQQGFTVRCLECNYRATDKEEITKHVKDSHKSIVNDKCISFICIECGETFAEDENYQKHMSFPHDKLCTECDKIFHENRCTQSSNAFPLLGV